MSTYAELQAASNYSFLRGASHVEELLLTARQYGIAALGITDHNTLAGIARAHARAAEVGVRLVVGCRLDLCDSLPLLLYPTGRAAYGRLCRLVTLGKSQGGKSQGGKKQGGKSGFTIAWDDLARHAEGLLGVLLPERADAALAAELDRHRALFGDRAYLELSLLRRPGDAARLLGLSQMAARARVATLATGKVLYHAPERRILQDVLTCIREGCTIDEAGFRRERSVDRAMKRPEEMIRLFAAHPEAIARTLEVAERCRFSLSELAYQYPDEADEPGQTPQQALARAVEANLPWRYPPDLYPGGVPDDVAAQLAHELRLIAALSYAPYFLTVNAIVRHARGQGILCQGRGSAANSAVCYVLGITAIDPVRSGLLFERFVSAERREPPDIDVDFESGRREEVIQWIYRRYGRDRAALCATVMRFQPRGAIRDVGRVLGLTEEVTGALARQVWGRGGGDCDDGVQEEHVEALDLNLSDRRLRMALQLARELVGFPRQLGTHPGGFVLTSARLDELVPIAPAAMADRQVIEWDKDDIDALRFMKVDVLGLGMLGCMRRAFALLAAHRGVPLDLASIPAEDPATYAMIRRADTLGTFQIESRAQMSMLPRLKPATFYDLVVQVAIVRPGPIQGDMVHPYLRRRAKREPVAYPKPELERVLGKTLGVPLFQEQAMQVAIQCAGFTPGEADQLRRGMATFKVTGGVSHFRDKLVDGMVARGYERAFAERTFSQLEGFGSYGFPESHAASFALLAYASSWMKCHHPDVFCAALLNAQPMGFYAPAQIVRDASEHGVAIRPVCVNASDWDCALQPGEGGDGRGYFAVRLGLRMVKGLPQADADRLVAGRGAAPYRGIEQLWSRTGIASASLERLAEADAFCALGLDRRQALWQVRGLAGGALPLFAAAAWQQLGRSLAESEPPVRLRAMREGLEVVEDYRAVGLSLRAHPVSFLRPALRARGMVDCAALSRCRDGRRVAVAGIVLVRQRPGSAKGVMFMTIEDETGVANLVLWPDRFEAQRALVLQAGMLACHGRVQRGSEDGGEVVHVVTERLEDLSAALRGVGEEAAHPAGRDPRGITVTTRDFR